MKRIVSLILIVAMICCCASAETFGASAGTFEDKCCEFAGWISANLGDPTYIDVLFSDRYEEIPNEAYIFGGNAYDLTAYFRSDPRSGEIAYCCFVTTTVDELLLAMQCCSAAMMIYLTDAIEQGGGNVSFTEEKAAAYEELLCWGDEAYIESMTAFMNDEEYVSSAIETDYFTVSMRVVEGSNGLYAAIACSFGSPEEVIDWYEAVGMIPAKREEPQLTEKPIVKATAAPYTNDTGNCMYVVNCQEWVSLRRTNHTTAERLAKVPFGAEVTNAENAGNGFIRCTYNGVTGYIQSKYLSPTKEYTPVSSYSTPYKGTAEQPYPDEGFFRMYPSYKSFKGSRYKASSSTKTVGDYLFSVGSKTYTVVNCNSFVNLREEANAYTDSIFEVPKGASVEVNGELNNWMLCRYEGRYGWIKAGFLRR